jgi:hypothetical protein
MFAQNLPRVCLISKKTNRTLRKCDFSFTRPNVCRSSPFSAADILNMLRNNPSFNAFVTLTILHHFLKIPTSGSSNRRQVRCRDQLFANQCQYFRWGGNSGLHHYVCCNNCQVDVELTQIACDGTTYQSASSGQYCSNCGDDRGSAGCGDKFTCGGYVDKSNKISTKIIKFERNLPGMVTTSIFKKKFQKNFKFFFN